MLDEGYAWEKIGAKIDAIEGLNPEEKSALWVWAWTLEDMGRQQARVPPDAGPGPPGG
jgi:hypothetical protein